MQHKLDILYDLVSKKFKVFYIDSDVLLFKNPIPYLSSLTGYDVIAQRDASLCSGFLFFNPTNTSISILRYAKQIRKEINKGDQHSIIESIRKHPLSRVKLLDERFPSGKVFFAKYQYFWDFKSSFIFIIRSRF
jgi:hypothetical protein